MEDFKQINFGGSGGNQFDMTFINRKIITLQGDNLLDSITIGNDRRGGNGGANPTSLFVNGDTNWIKEVTVRADQKIDFLKLVPTEGQAIQAGGGGGKESTYRNIKLLGIGGNAGRVVDSLKLLYIPDYKPSTMLEEDVIVIYAVKTSGKYKMFSQEESKYMDSFVSICKKFESSMDASAKADLLTGGYTGTASLVATSLETTITNVSEKLKNDSCTEEKEIRDDQLGIIFGSCQIRESKGVCFPVPNGAWSFMIKNKSEWPEMFNEYYDLTNVATQFLNAASKACYNKVKKYGMSYLTCK